MSLQLRGYVALPPHTAGAFDHGDVHPDTARMFVAHTAFDTVDVIDGERLELIRTVSGCPEGNGVLCVQACGRTPSDSRACDRALMGPRRELRALLFRQSIWHCRPVADRIISAPGDHQAAIRGPY